MGIFRADAYGGPIYPEPGGQECIRFHLASPNHIQNSAGRASE